MVNYIADGFITAVKCAPLWWQTMGLSFTASGYGTNIPTDKIAVCADNKRRRIRVIQTSNAGSAYIVVKGERLFIRDHQLPDVTA